MGIFTALLVLTSVLLIGMMYVSATRMSEDVTNFTLRMKIHGDINAAKFYVQSRYGKFSLRDGVLVGEGGKQIRGDYAMVDEIAEDLGVAATVFMRQGEDFVRISTNILKEDRKRAVGTMLGTASAAYGPVMDKKMYVGQADILGKPYLAAYDPILDESGEVIGILFLGIPRTEIQTISAQSMNELLGRVGVMLLAVLAGATVVTYVFTSRLNRQIMGIVSMLSENSDTVHAASEQVSEASRSLAQGAAEQSSGLEETSSSLEEMAGMTRQNAENALSTRQTSWP